MAYSQPWSETIPNGATTLASDIDLVFQQLRRDLRERMNTLINDWTTDPVGTRFGCALYMATADQSIPNGTITSINWDAEIFDNGALHDTVTNNSRITIPTNGNKGVWLFSAQVTFANNATGSRSVFISKNGNPLRDAVDAATSGTYAKSMRVTALINSPTVGDFFEVQVQQDSGVALSVLHRTLGVIDSSYFDAMQLVG